MDFHDMGIMETVAPEEIKFNVMKCLKDRKLINGVTNNCIKFPIAQYTSGQNKNAGGQFTSLLVSVEYFTKI